MSLALFDLDNTLLGDPESLEQFVGIIKKPFRTFVGDMSSQTSMPMIIKKRVIKKMAVGAVQYIHSRPIKIPLYTRPRAKPLAM